MIEWQTALVPTPAQDKTEDELAQPEPREPQREQDGVIGGTVVRELG
jgi:hypothetical protein